MVLGIAGLLVAIVPTSLERLRDGGQYRDTVRTIVSELRQGRQLASSKNDIVVFSVDTVGRTFGLQGNPVKSIPDALTLKTTVGLLAVGSSAVSKQQQTADIVFLPDGGASGGTIELTRPSGSGVRIKVDWLTGKVTQVVF